MADYYSKSVFQPSIPKTLFTGDDLAFLAEFHIDTESDGDDKLYLFAEDWCTNAFIEEDEGIELTLDEDDLFARLQEIIRRSNGELAWIFKETSYDCSKMRPDGFGGSSVFITADDIQYFGTSSWLEQRISEAETGDSGPYTEDDEKCALGLLKDILLAFPETDPSSSLHGEPIDGSDAVDFISDYLVRVRDLLESIESRKIEGAGIETECPVCRHSLEKLSTDTHLGIDRELFTCPGCNETFIRELNNADRTIERAVKCIMCSFMVSQSTSHIFYRSDDLAHYVGDCCWSKNNERKVVHGG